MGIYIKGMEMPKDKDIVLRIDEKGEVYVYGSYQTELHKAVPVPPHGLIDREQILDSIRIELAQANAVNDMEDYDSWMRVFDYVRKFPTIISAEEG